MKRENLIALLTFTSSLKNFGIKVYPCSYLSRIRMDRWTENISTTKPTELFLL